MKTFWMLTVSAGLGIALGVATSWAHLDRDVEPDPLIVDQNTAEPATSTETSGLHPKVEVDVTEHDFGQVATRQTVEHTFVFKNVGEAPLRLVSGGTSCTKCTISSVPGKAIQPGESADVVVQYSAADRSDTFRQTATVMTTDPERARVELTVSGKVIAPLDLEPATIVFSRLSATETRTAKLTAVAAIDPNFAIESFDLLDAETAKFFQVAIEPLPAAELEALGGKRGYQVAITILPGMPLGPVRQRLLLHTNLPEMKDVLIPIEASIESDITIAGADFLREHGLLTIGAVGREGAERKLWVRIHGEQRHTIQVSVASATPPLEVTLGEASDANMGAVVQIPLVVKIPPGSPSANHLSNYGKILLGTNDPEAKQLRIWVQFAVEE